MSWLDKILPPKIKREGKSESAVPEGLWHKCPACAATVYTTDLVQNDKVCPKCGHHNAMGARERLNLLLDEEGREEIARREAHRHPQIQRQQKIPRTPQRRQKKPPAKTTR